MSRLVVRLVAALVGVTLLAIALTSLPQLTGIMRENRQLPLSERSDFNPGQMGRAFFGEGGPPSGFLGLLGVSPEELRAGEWPELSRAADGRWVAMQDMAAYLRGSLERRAATLVGSVLLAVALAAVLAIILARSISRPIREVASAADRVAAGDLSVRVPVSRPSASERDETARLGRSFNVMADGLERLERQRRDMVADVAHELRTPLTVLRGRLEALEDGVIPFDQSEVTDMHAQVLVLARLVEDLRVLSLADSGKLTLDLRTVDLAELARSVVGAYQLHAVEKEISVVASGAEPVLVRADRERMLQVLGNLVDNAVRHTPAGGTVTVTSSLDGSAARVSVVDTGAGIPAAEREKLFDRFYRADESRTRAAGGSGLGLAIVKAIVDLHGGTVTINANEGAGTEVEVTLPAGDVVAS